jgi:putative transposase
MSRNYYSEINLHIKWHCKESAPMLTAQVEPVAHRIIKQRLANTPEVFLHEIGGTDTHAHVAVTVPPSLTISEFVGQLKGASSHDVNQQFAMRGKVLQWQAGYGVVSFGTKDLPWVRQYIRNQREHHATGRTSNRLERITEIETDMSNRSPVNGADAERGDTDDARHGLPGLKSGPNSG